MRFVLAILLVFSSASLVAAQGTAKPSDEVLRQRLLLKERFNKGYDVQIENANDRIEGRCKGEAKRKFSALHPLKRRKFTRDCIARARR